jgi:hypothetical protein
MGAICDAIAGKIYSGTSEIQKLSLPHFGAVIAEPYQDTDGIHTAAVA